MELRLLGPVELRDGDARVNLGPRRQRFVLAALALEVNQPIPLDRLIDLAWPVSVPRTAAHAVMVCVSNLRAVLARAGIAAEDAELIRHGSGYLLRADPMSIDAHRFRALVEQARAAPADGRRVALLDDALRLWCGPPLDGCAPQETRELLCRGLEETRLAALEDRLDAKLRLGRHREILDELTALVDANPLRERPAGQLMLALHRSGRTGEALAAYRGVRERLAGELGLDPGPDLQRLESAILREDPAVAAPVAAVAARPGLPAVPAQLPPAIAGFAGRGTALAWLDALLAEPRPGSPVVAAISGTAGVGKTSLAVHWAHRVADRFPDGQLYLNLRGFDPAGTAVTPAEALHAFLDALGVPAERRPVDVEAQAALYRGVLSGRRMLVLLDNAATAEQVRPLLPGTPGCLALATSRNHLAGLVATDGARPLTLDLLAPAEARDLLAHRLGRGRLSGQARAADEVIRLCASLPLALAIVAARAATHPGFPLDALAEELRLEPTRLDTLDTGEAPTRVRAVFSWSYQHLSTGAATLFRLLGLHPGPDIGVLAAASLAGIPPETARPLLAELVATHLVTEHAPGRYTFHDLLRLYAGEQARRTDAPDDRAAAVRRLLDHYLHTGHDAALLLYPTRQPIDPPPPSAGVSTARLAGHEQALAWFTVEHPVLLAAVARAVEEGLDRYACQLAWTLEDYFDYRGHWQDWAATQRHALDAAYRLGDRRTQANAHRGLGQASTRLERYDDADRHLRLANDRFAELGDDVGRAQVEISLSYAAERQATGLGSRAAPDAPGQTGRTWFAEALRHSEQALALYESVGDRAGQARAFNAVGWYHAQLGNHHEALSHCEKALALHREVGDPLGQGATWDSLGYAYHHLGDHQQAVVCYRNAVELCRQAGDRAYEAEVLIHLGDTQRAADDPDNARRTWRTALDILTDLRHPDADRVRERLSATRAG